MGPHIRGILLGLREQEVQRLLKRSHLGTVVVVVGAETYYNQFSSVFIHFLALCMVIYPPTPNLPTYSPSYPFIHPAIYPPTLPPIHLPTQPHTYTPMHLSLHSPPIHLSTHLQTHPPAHLPTHSHIPTHSPNYSSTPPPLTESLSLETSCLLSLHVSLSQGLGGSPHLQDARKARVSEDPISLVSVFVFLRSDCTPK